MYFVCLYPVAYAQTAIVLLIDGFYVDCSEMWCIFCASGRERVSENTFDMSTYCK